MNNELVFIKIYGYIIIAIFVGCVYAHYSLLGQRYHSDYIGIGLSLWYLTTGIGILMRTKWGYYLFKFFLYSLLLGFPIGTIIAFKSLSYMKKYNIKQFFINGKFGRNESR